MQIAVILTVRHTSSKSQPNLPPLLLGEMEQEATTTASSDPFAFKANRSSKNFLFIFYFVVEFGGFKNLQAILWPKKIHEEE